MSGAVQGPETQTPGAAAGAKGWRHLGLVQIFVVLVALAAVLQYFRVPLILWVAIVLIALPEIPSLRA